MIETHECLIKNTIRYELKKLNYNRYEYGDKSPTRILVTLSQISNE